LRWSTGQPPFSKAAFWGGDRRSADQPLVRDVKTPRVWVESSEGALARRQVYEDRGSLIKCDMSSGLVSLETRRRSSTPAIFAMSVIANMRDRGAPCIGPARSLS